MNSIATNHNIDVIMLEKIEQLLGRAPRGLEAVEVVDAQGNPSVIRVASLVDNKPFPTMFWLVDKTLKYKLDQLEASGLILELQARIDNDETLLEMMAADHQRYIALREQNMSPEIKQRLIDLNYFDALQKRGIGGIANFSRIRCLHTYYAAHLVKANTIGKCLDQDYF